MATAIHVPGLATVKIDAGQGGGLQTLGTTVDGVDIDEEVFFSDIQGDANGGSEGPPIEIAYFGEIARVRTELNKYDTAVMAAVEARLPSGTAGVIGTAGTILFANTEYCRLLIDTADSTFVRNYPFALARNAISFTLSTKHKRLILDWECHAVSGTLWNTTNT